MKTLPKANTALNSPIMILVAIFAASLVIRILLVPFTPFGSDEIALYQNGLSFFLTGNLPASGPNVVYTGTRMPGALNGVLVGLPLFISHGWPSAAVVALAVWNWVGMGITFLLYRRIFPELRSTRIAALILLAPWSFLFNNLWNPNYLPLLSAVYAWGLFQFFQYRGTRNHPKAYAWGAGLMTLSTVLALQLHLSFVVLALLPAVLLATQAIPFKKFFHPASITGGALGILLGGLLLIPALITPSEGGSLLRNIQFNAGAGLDVLRVFFRFLSFPTGETSRFFADSRGFAGTIDWFLTHPGFGIFFAISLFGTAFIFLKGLNFYTAYVGKKFVRTPWDHTVFWLPILTGITFFFSVKSASAHTFWILFPFSFYPALRMIPRGSIPDWAITLFVVTSLTASLGSVMLQRSNPAVLTLERTELWARAVYKDPNVTVPPEFVPGVEAILKGAGTPPR